jgi:hypothetical protein
MVVCTERSIYGPQFSSETTDWMMMTTTTAAPGFSTTAAALRRLYFVRFAFALVWAIVMIPLAKHLNPLTATLFVVYPLFDVVAAAIDSRASRAIGSPRLLYVNIVVSLLAAIGLGVAGMSDDASAVLRVWGIWAVVAGLVQLIVGVTRRKMGGQWPMIISGGISVLAGGSFIVGASADNPALSGAAGYAIPGAIFFLIAAIRLGRAAKSN